MALSKRNLLWHFGGTPKRIVVMDDTEAAVAMATGEYQDIRTLNGNGLKWFFSEGGGTPSGITVPVYPDLEVRFRPDGSNYADLAALQAGSVAPPQAFAAGQFVTLEDASKASWNGTAWQAGAMPLPTGATAGTPGSFTPATAGKPVNLTHLQAIGALGQTTAWTVGQYIGLSNGTTASWNGTAWVAGAAPAVAVTGVTPGAPGAFSPPEATIPADLTALQALGALGQSTAWATGENVVLGDASTAHWNGTAWTAGAAT